MRPRAWRLRLDLALVAPREATPPAQSREGVLDLVEGRDRHEPLLRKFGKALEGILPGEARLAGGAFGRAEARGGGPSDRTRCSAQSGSRNEEPDRSRVWVRRGWPRGHICSVEGRAARSVGGSSPIHQPRYPSLPLEFSTPRPRLSTRRDGLV